MRPDYLAVHAELSLHQYAVINRILFPDLSDQLPVIELVSPLLAPQAHLYPYLLPIRELSSTQWQILMDGVQQAEGRDSPPLVSLWLQSDLSPSEVKSRLLEILIMQDEQRQYHILRFYDPRVLFHLHWMLSPWEFSGKLSMRLISAWTFWLDGQWHTLAYKQPVPFDPLAPKITVARLQHIGLINRVLAEMPPIIDLVERQQLSQRIEALLQQCPLSSPDDQRAFCLHGVTRGQAIYKTPKMAALLAESTQYPGYYARLTASWNDNDWQEMIKEKRHYESL